VCRTAIFCARVSRDPFSILRGNALVKRIPPFCVLEPLVLPAGYDGYAEAVASSPASLTSGNCLARHIDSSRMDGKVSVEQYQVEQYQEEKYSFDTATLANRAGTGDGDATTQQASTD
jgi:hypothetical protein